MSRRIYTQSILLLFLFVFSAYANAACDIALPAQGVRDDVLIIINDNSVDSCEVGRYYAAQRGLGQNNVLHVRTPANYFIDWTNFKILRDQVIDYMQQRIAARNPSFVPVTCTDGDMPYYCQASMDQLRASTGLRYIVMTKGVPSRVRVDGSTLWFANSPTSIDNYFKYWLVNYFSKDIAFSALSRNRASAFSDGRNIRIAEPAIDNELIVGRIDGITLGSAKALIDRIQAAEANGLYGKVYSYTGKGGLNGPTGMRWKDYSNGLANIYDGNGDPWRYQFGIFGESAPGCNDYQNASNYLNFSQTDSRGKTPQSCTVKLSVGLNGANDQPPARLASRQPLADDAIWYMGYLDGQPTANGSFNDFLNWRRNTSCTNTLCENLPASEQAACRAASTDVYKEIDTSCVGVADGFMGYNYQSFPVSFLHIAPTGWNTGTAEGFKTGRAIVRNDMGSDDAMSLWYQNNEEIAAPVCYTSSDFSTPATTNCSADMLMNFSQQINFPSVQTSNVLAPDQYRLRFKYKAENLNRAITLKAYIQVTELASKKRVTYKRVNASVAIPANTITGWQDAEAIITFNHGNANHDVNWDGTYQRISVFMASNTTYTGAIGVDTVTLEKLDPAGVAAPTPIALVNPRFDQGHKQVTTGDHAANFLNRLNGVGFWGSLSHHQSGGHSFSRHALETMVYFMRGLPLGDAVWFAEDYNSGIFYGDPLYSPVAIKLADINRPYNFILGNVSLQGHTVNGRDANVVTTSYQVDHCSGSDFYVCDLQGSWQSSGLGGAGGQENTRLGVWDTSSLAPGAYTIRLAVTSSNQATGRNQTFYDYYPVVVADQTSDFDGDGVSDVNELNGGMDPTNTDTDGDGLSDGAEMAAGTSPTNSDSDGDGLSDGVEVLTLGTNPLNADSDDDGMPDGWEAGFTGLNPLLNDAALDLDADDLNNLAEYTNSTNPTRADTDFDGVNDGEEVANNTDPLSNADTDLDGMSNDWESLRGTQLNIDDARVDADGDGVDNVIEFFYRTLPLDASSAPLLGTVYVDSVNGSNASGDGSISNPYAGLSRAIAAAKTGDTVSLASGSYGSGVFFSLSKMVSIEGPADRSASVSFNYMYISGLNWGGFSNVQMNVQSFFNYAGGRNIVFNNVDLRLGTTMNLGRNTKVLFDHVLVTNTGAVSLAINAPEVSKGVSRSEFVLRNSTVTGFALGLDWNTSQFLQVRDSIMNNTVDFKDVYGYQVWNSLVSDGQFTGLGNIAGAPLFVDAVNGDYHLLPASPAIDSANPYASALAEPDSLRLNMGFYGGTTEATLAQDNDNDGLPDGWEVAVGLNPADPLDRLMDSDNDGVNNTLEYRAGTLPNASSSRRGTGYWILNPGQFNNSLEVMALVDGSYVSAPGFVRLNEFETTSIDTSSMVPGQRIGANQAMSIANTADGTDMPVPDWFAGRAFVLPHFRNSHRYYLYSPYGDAQVSIDLNGTVQTLKVQQNKTRVFNAGNNNSYSGLVHSDLPIVITHSATGGGQLRDVYAVPPAAMEVSGVYSNFVLIGALEDNTQVTITDSNGVTTQLTLNEGDRNLLSGGGASQGQGVAMRIVADKPVAAIQAADQDGIEATAFWDPIYSGRRYGLPIDIQYVAISCRQTSTISLYDMAGSVLATQNCSPGLNGQPGKAYFGAASNGANILAGSYLIGDAPFYMIFESAVSNDEKNILGHL